MKREYAYAARIVEVQIAADIEDEEENNDLVIADISGTLEEEIIQREVCRKLRDIDGHLTPDQQLIFAHLANDLSQHEIARQMNTSQARIRYHILKIRELFLQVGLTPACRIAGLSKK